MSRCSIQTRTTILCRVWWFLSWRQVASDGKWIAADKFQGFTIHYRYLRKSDIAPNRIGHIQVGVCKQKGLFKHK